MKPEGWIFMIAAWLAILMLLVYTMAKTLRSRQNGLNNLRDQVADEPKT